MRLLIFLCLALSACTPSTDVERRELVYFDLKGYFENESHRLNSINAPVLKTVSRNGRQETKTVKADWSKELSLFRESDINKAAWKNSYRKLSKKNGGIDYLAIEDNLKTRRVEIRRAGSRVISIRIVNRTSNFLYHSTEELTYYPDSMYVINKHQDVHVLGKNKYLISGQFE